MRAKASFLVSLRISIFFAVLCTAATISGKVIYVDDSAIGSNDGTRWENAYIYLQDALADANTAEKPVEIRIAQGVYTPDQGAGITPGNQMAEFQLINGVSVLGGFAGVGATEPDARYIEAYRSIFSGDLARDDADVDNPDGYSDEPTRAENSSSIVSGDDTNETAVLDGVTITAGGIGISNWFGSPSVANCTFTYTRTGIFSLHSDQRIIGCTFKGIWSEAIYESGGNLILIDCAFVGNTGRAIHCSPYGELTLHNCTFIDNNVRGPEMISCTFQENIRMYGCKFINNTISGLAVVWSDVNQEFIAENCIFAGNVGVAIKHWSKRLVISNCVFAGNMGDNQGGVIDSDSQYNSIQNCTFSDNSSKGDSSVLYLRYGGKISNCIFWSNNSPAIENRFGEITINYCNIEAGWPGEGNIDVDPCFVSSGYWDQNGTPEDVNDDLWVEGDYHLQSQAGHWDQQSKTWVQDNLTSPCIDAGDPNSPIGAEPFPNGGRLNIGAYCTTNEASKSYFGKPVPEVIISGDINGDGVVDDEDLAILNSHWMMRAEDQVNKPPIVRLVEPQNGDRIAWRGPTTFIAEASDPDGQVDRVWFYAQYKKTSGGVRTRGYEDIDGSDGWEIEFTWPEESYFGEWTAWAEATDNEGEVSISPEIKITLYRP
jgi:hypothetical protein